MSMLASSRLRIAVALALVALLAASAYAQPPERLAEEAAEKEAGQIDAGERGADKGETGPEAIELGRPGRRPSFPPGLAEARLIEQRAEAIGVGEETLEKLEKLVAEIREKEEELRARTVESGNQVRALLDENLPKEKALLKAGYVGSGVARETRELRLRCSLRVRALLTKDQLEKFMELRKEAIGKKRSWRGRPGR